MASSSADGPSDADAEALGGGLERGGGVAVEAEAQAQHVALEFGEPVERAAHPVHQHPLVHVGGPVLRVRCHEVPSEVPESAAAGWSRLAATRATPSSERRSSAEMPVASVSSSSVGARPSWPASSVAVASSRCSRSPTSRGMRMVRPCCWTAR